MLSARVEIALLALAAVVGCLALFVRIDTGPNWFFWGPVFDAGHYPFFFLATLCSLRLMRFLPRRRPRFLHQPYLLMAVAVVAVELIQPYFKRSASFVDIQNGLLGIAAAGLVVRSMKSARSHLQRLLILGSAAALIIPLLWPTRGSLHAIQWREQNFPVLARFSDTPESLLWGGLEPRTASLRPFSETNFVRSSSLNGGTGLKVSTRPGYYSGVGYSAGDFDWSPFQNLKIVVSNPDSQRFALLLRIDDSSPESSEFDGRYNRSFQLAPGKNVLSIPLSAIESGPKYRKLNTRKIRGLLIFVDQNDQPRRFILEELHLE